MVLTTVVWIFSTMSISLFWTNRIWGAVCMAMVRVRSRSESFFSKRSQAAVSFCTASASSVRPVARAFAASSASWPERTSSSFFRPARMYMVSSLKYVRLRS